MMAKEDKSEQPTPKRLKDARKRGEVAKTPDLSAGISVLAFSIVLVPLWNNVTKKFIHYLIFSIEQVDTYERLLGDLSHIGMQAIAFFATICFPFFVISLLLGFFANFMQVGLLFSGKAIKPAFRKINPVNGFKQLFSKQALMNLLKTMGKFIVVVLFCWKKIQVALPILLNASEFGTEKLLYFLLDFIKELAQQIGIFLVILAFVDYLFQRYSHRKNLKMTKQEVKEEYKQMEGDPQVKSQRKALYQEMSKNTISHVKEASVLITNPTHFAIALRYDPKQDVVPVVLAKGSDELAQRMKKEAKIQKVPMIENRPVARALYAQVKAGDTIPVQWYEAVAEIIALVYQLEEKNKGKL